MNKTELQNMMKMSSIDEINNNNSKNMSDSGSGSGSGSGGVSNVVNSSNKMLNVNESNDTIINVNKKSKRIVSRMTSIRVNARIAYSPTKAILGPNPLDKM